MEAHIIYVHPNLVQIDVSALGQEFVPICACKLSQRPWLLRVRERELVGYSVSDSRQTHRSFFSPATFGKVRLMRPIFVGFFLVVVAVFNAPAGVLYSFSQSPYNPPGSYPSPAIYFDFTVPSLITSPTLIPGSSNPPVVPLTGLNYSIIPDSIINSPGVHDMGLNLSIMSVSIEPGLNGTTPMIGISMGWGSQVVMSEGVCFDSIPSCYSTLRPTGAQVFDHFGTYTHGDIQLTISPTDVPQAATPEPRFEAAAGLVALLMVIGVARRTRRTVADQATC